MTQSLPATPHSVTSRILHGLLRAKHGFLAACHAHLYEFLAHAEGGRAFRSVHIGDAPAGARAHIEQPAARTQTPGAGVHDAGDFGKHAPYGDGHQRIFGI